MVAMVGGWGTRVLIIICLADNLNGKWNFSDVFVIAFPNTNILLLFECNCVIEYYIVFKY